MVTQAASKAKQEKAAKKEAKKEVKKEVAKVVAAKPKKERKKKAAAVIRSVGTTPVVKQVAAPAAIGKTERNYFNVKPLPGSRTGIRIRGCEFLDTVTTTTSQAVGDVLFNGPINPSAFVGTRLAIMAATFDKYRFNRFRFIAVPFAGTNTNGGYGLAYDRDPSDETPAGGVSALRAWNAMPNTVQGSVWETLTVDCPIMDPTTDYFVNSSASGDERLVDQGQVYMFCSTAITTAVNFNLLVEYDLCLWIPELSPTLSSVKYGAVAGNSTIALANNNVFSALSNTVAAWPTAGANISGDIGRLPIVVGPVDPTSNPSGTNYALKVPGGLWTLAQLLQATAANWTGGFGFQAPNFVPNDPKEALDYATTALNLYTAAAGTGVTQAISAIYDLLVPPAGGYLFGRFTGTWPTAQTGATMTVLLNPSRTSNTLSLALVSAGKWKRAHMRKHVEEELKREKDEIDEKGKAHAPPINLVQQSCSPSPGLQMIPAMTAAGQLVQYAPQNISSPSMPTYRQ